MPDVRLSGLLLDRELLGYQHSRAQFASWLEPPRPQLTLMIDLDGSLDADGEVLLDAWISGLSDRPTVVGFGDTYGAIDLKLMPLGAYALTGIPLCELAGACVALADVFGRDGTELAGRLRESADWDERFAELGCSRRYLRDGFVRQVGLPPKTVARLMRFHSVRERIQDEPDPAHPRWGEVAHAAGYADQSHLNREFRELAGTTPSDFVRRLIPAGGVVGDRSH